jgi:hypothetical protein
MSIYKEIESNFNREMFQKKAGIRMKYVGQDYDDCAIFDITPMKTLGLIIDAFALTDEMEDFIDGFFKEQGKIEYKHYTHGDNCKVTYTVKLKSV